MYEWYYNKNQPFFGVDNLKLRYMGADSLKFSFKLFKSLIKDLKHFKEDFDFSVLDPTHDLHSKAK